MKYRERTYPFILSSYTIANRDVRCEACKEPAKFRIEYESSKSSLQTSIIYLCGAHERLAKYGNWNQVFRDMDKTIESSTE